MPTPTKLRPSRTSGVLLHPTSLPGPFGIGDLGPAAYSFVDALSRTRQTWWQILPLGPTAYGDSPYQCFSAFAGNPYLVSPELLVREGLLSRGELDGVSFPADRVDYGSVIPWKVKLLDHAWQRYQSGSGASLRDAFERYCHENAFWLNDFALFMALKDVNDGKSWHEWPADLRLRRPEALAAARHNHGNRAASHQFRQFLFARQWSALRHYARQRGVKFIGDAPIFVAGDSADVWSNPELFLLDSNRRPTVVAGVPPDYFSATGQLWGNPLYDWDAMRRHGYGWWTARLKAILAQVDLVRLDHFRGFAAAWHVPNGHKTAEHGTWIPGPGADLFSRLRAELGGLPFIAEDLGLITEDVEQLRLAFGLPGMAILQFAFGSGSTNKYLPHNFVPLSAVYTGTHDNDTTRGWYSNTSEKERDHVRRYLGRDCSDVAWDLIRLAWQSVADFAITPLQDLMNLGSEARMNSPGNPIGNWCWRFAENALTSAIFNGLEELTVVYGRESN